MYDGVFGGAKVDVYKDENMEDLALQSSSPSSVCCLYPHTRHSQEYNPSFSYSSADRKKDYSLRLPLFMYVLGLILFIPICSHRQQSHVYTPVYTSHLTSHYHSSITS